MIIFILFSLSIAIDTYNEEINKISFGSCCKQTYIQNHWNLISQHKSDIFLWLGDAIYSTCPDCVENDWKVMLNNTNYKKFKKKHKIFGTWDDHDYGCNDCGANLKSKENSKIQFLKFLNVSDSNVSDFNVSDLNVSNFNVSDSNVSNFNVSDSNRYKRDGVYSSHVFGDKLRIILLDTRYNRDNYIYLNNLTNIKNRYLQSISSVMLGICRYICISILCIHNNGDILGNKQWIWLENELSNNKYKINIIVTSIQMLSDFSFVESWNHFSKSKNKFLNLLEKYTPKGLILLSGDVHYSELLGETDGLLEVTSSGLTHATNTLIGGFFFDNFLRFFIGYNRLYKNSYYGGKNYGILDIDYVNNIIYINIYDAIKNDIKLNTKIKIKEDINEIRNDIIRSRKRLREISFMNPATMTGISLLIIICLFTIFFIKIKKNKKKKIN
eukprot:GHVL01035504.1.p1 GENE.GHVL01035504.1~~GHVL01035504.1.p1  ORF type:complete len:453 (+),score=121.94 GHVL01035504.1:39-1361(+)